MSNRIGGDFNQDAMDAFRLAYAQELFTPDQEEVANNSGLPTNVVDNTSPWHEHVGLWKYPSGKGPDQDLRSAFDPNQFFSNEVEGEEAMSDEEVENLINEIAGDDSEESDEAEDMEG